VIRNQRLVGGDHVFAGTNRRHDHLERDVLTAHELDDDRHIRRRRDLHGVCGEFNIARIAIAFARQIAHRRGNDTDVTPGTARDFVRVAGKHVYRA